MIKYYVAETTPGAAVTLWKETRAKSLQGAKRAAQAARVFQGTCAHIAEENPYKGFSLVATRYLAGSLLAGWADYAPD